MATIDVGASPGRRSFDHSLPLVPFIDFLLCLISFLLITAAWSQMARVNADASVPGPLKDPTPPAQSRVLHLEAKDSGEGYSFKLVWREGAQVLDSLDVPRDLTASVTAGPAYPQLAASITEQWSRSSARHFAATDPSFDQLVIHTDNAMPFEHVIAVIDAANRTQRQWRAPSGEVQLRPAFTPTFAVN